MLNLLKSKLPLYDISSKIKKQYFEENDKQFYIQMRNLNLLVTTIYTAYVFFEFKLGIDGPYLYFNIFLLVITSVIYLGIAYAQITNKIYLNYWFLVILIMRIAVGLIQGYFTDFQYQIDDVSYLISSFYSYHIMEGFLYLIINVSHQTRILVPIFVHFFVLFCFFLGVYNVMGSAQGVQKWIGNIFCCVATIIAVIYKLYLLKKNQEKLHQYYQQKQDSKEYIIDMLQQGILILSQKKASSFQKQRSQNQNQPKEQNYIEEKEIKVEFSNTAFQVILNLNKNENQQDSLENLQILKKLDLKILQEESNFIKQKSSITDNNDKEQVQLRNIEKDKREILSKKMNDRIIKENHISYRKTTIKKSKKYSIKTLLNEDFEEVEKKIFRLINQNEKQQDDNQQGDQQQIRYVQIKIKKFEQEERSEVAIQIIDISNEIVNYQIEKEINLDNKIKGWICHELQNPLNSIINSAEIIESCFDYENPEKFAQGFQNKFGFNDFQRIKRNLKILVSSGKMLRLFISDINDFERVKTYKMIKNITKFDLRETINEVIMMQDFDALKKEIKIELQFNSENDITQHVETDQLRFQQILLNVLSNAVKYTQNGGQIYIKVDIIEKCQDDRQEKYLQVAVQDNGYGISFSDQAKIFQLLGSIQNDKNMNKKGIGLGLLICKIITQEFDGNIDVHSQLGVGSTFTFEMKLSQGQLENCLINKIQNIEFENIQKNQNSQINKLQQVNNIIILNQFNNIEKKEDEKIEFSEQELEFLKQFEEMEKNKINNKDGKDQLSLKSDQIQNDDDENEFQAIKKIRRGITLKDIIIESNILQFNQNVQESKLKLQKVDLLSQFKEFKKTPMIDLQINYSQLNLQDQINSNQINISKEEQELNQIKKFYKKINDKIPKKCGRSGETNINETEKGEIFEQIIRDYHYEKDKLMLQNLGILESANHQKEIIKSQHFTAQFQNGYQESAQKLLKFEQLQNSDRTELQYSFFEENENFNMKNSRNVSISQDIENQQNSYYKDIIITKSIRDSQMIYQYRSQNQSERKKTQNLQTSHEYLTLMDKKQVLQKNKIKEINPPKGKRPRIMIVDDVYFNIEILKDVMQQVLKIDVDREVVEAFNGQQAIIKYLQLHREHNNQCPIELILMDCDMPILNGFKATEFILKFAQKEKQKMKNQCTVDKQADDFCIPEIIAITADSSVKQQVLAKNAGMNIFLHKPIKSQVLKNILHKYVEIDKN